MFSVLLFNRVLEWVTAGSKDLQALLIFMVNYPIYLFIPQILAF